MKAPLFSVVVPTHNRVELLRRALDSVIAQSFTDYEIVVVDDGSSDATPQFLAGFNQDNRRAVRHEVGSGASAARNAGVAVARGEYVVFLDDDDELRPNALDALRRYLQTFPQLTFLWGGRLVREKDPQGRLVSTRHEVWADCTAGVHGASFLPFVLQVATNCAFTIRRSVFNELGGFDVKFRVSEDRDLFLSLAAADYVGGAIPKVLIDVDEHFKNSLSRNIGVQIGPDTDLRVIKKHQSFLSRLEHLQFVNDYLLSIFAGYLQAGNRRAAMQIAAELNRRKALDVRVLRKYIRHAPEFRALKAVLGYGSLRRLKNRLTTASAT